MTPERVELDRRILVDFAADCEAADLHREFAAICAERLAINDEPQIVKLSGLVRVIRIHDDELRRKSAELMASRRKR
jgi:hypothetical protein